MSKLPIPHDSSQPLPNIPRHPSLERPGSSTPSSPSRLRPMASPTLQPQPLNQMQSGASTLSQLPQSSIDGQTGLSTNGSDKGGYNDQQDITTDNFDPNDVNYVVIPKHPSFISPVYRPNLILIQSDEAFIYLRVASLTMLLAFLCPICVFSSAYQVTLICVVGCLLCLLGFLGSLRKVRSLIYIFWYGMVVWVCLAVILASAITLFSSHYYDTAVDRCSNSYDYVILFTERPDGTKVDCSVNMHECLSRCVSHIETHFFATSALVAGLITVILIFFLYQLYNFIRRLIFPSDYLRIAKTLHKHQQEKYGHYYGSNHPLHGGDDGVHDDDEDLGEEGSIDLDLDFDYDLNGDGGGGGGGGDSTHHHHTHGVPTPRRRGIYFADDPSQRHGATLNDLEYQAPSAPPSSQQRQPRGIGAGAGAGADASQNPPPGRRGYRYSSDHHDDLPATNHPE